MLMPLFLLLLLCVFLVVLLLWPLEVHGDIPGCL